MLPLKNLAIKYALLNKWKDACAINEKILEELPQDLDSLNRLAFAFMKLGKFRKAKEIYKKVISIDKTNPIAIKNLKKLETISKQKGFNSSQQLVNTDISLDELFIEEAGKTKTIDLKNVADKRTLSLVQPGDQIFLVIKRSKIFVQTGEKKYIGMLPDSIGRRLITFIKGGNEYHGCVKAIDDKNARVFIKETKKSPRFKNQPSFTNITYNFQISPETEEKENTEED